MTTMLSFNNGKTHVYPHFRHHHHHHQVEQTVLSSVEQTQTVKYSTIDIPQRDVNLLIAQNQFKACG